MEEIVPLKNLGDFYLEESINKILTIINQKGDLFRNCDIVFGNNINEPIYLNLIKEGIKLRFNSKTQRLELIEKNFELIGNEIEYYYNNSLVFSQKNKEHIYYSSPDFNYINSIFGLSKIPKIINDGQNILLPYDGISFIFKNISKELESEKIEQNCPLEKMLIYSENNLINSLNKENSKLNNPSPLIKYSTEKENKIQINFIKKNDNSNITIELNESLVDVLEKMNNPNYIYPKKINENNTNELDDVDCCYVNYFDYGIDLLIDANNNDKIKKIILHSNNPLDTKFGIYEKCNFQIEMKSSYFQKNINFNQNIPQLNMIKLSKIKEKKYSPILEISNNYNITINNNEKYDNNHLEEKKELNEKEEKNTLDILESNKIKNYFENQQIKEFNGIFQNIYIHPLTNFSCDVLEKIPSTCYSVYQHTDTKINRIYKYYLFESIIFEVMENNKISSIIFYSNKKKNL